MSRARHQRAKGGAAPMVNKGREEEVENKMEASHKRGGKVKRASGGSVEMGEGMKPKMHRLDRPGRKRGGGVGADRSPLSSAARTNDAEGHNTDDEDD